MNNRYKSILHLYCAALLVIFISAGANAAHVANTVRIGEGDSWHYFKGTTDPPAKWNRSGFDFSTWQKGRSGFGYGPGKHNTLLDDMQGSYKTLYVRREFAVHDYANITRLSLSLFCDGPFVVYLNGIEALRSKRRQTGEQFNLIGFAHEFDHRTNVIALTCSNDKIDSDDYSFIPLFELKEE